MILQTRVIIVYHECMFLGLYTSFQVYCTWYCFCLPI